MRFENALFENFGTHKKLECAFSPRLTGIVGRNGSGKSTILAGLKYALTGAIPMAGNKEANISNFMTSGGARVLVNGIHNGERLEILRGLSAYKTQLKVDDGAAIIGETKVNDRLREIFGRSAELIDDYMFVEQGKLASFLDATMTQRANVFSQLFRTRYAEVCWAAVGKKLAMIEVPQRSESLDSLREAFGNAAEQLAALRATRKQYADLKDYDPEQDEDRGVVDAWKEYRRTITSRNEHKELCVEAARKLAITDRIATSAAEVLDKCAKETEKASKSADAAKLALSLWKTYQKNQTAIETVNKRRDELEAEHGTHKEPKRPKDYCDKKAQKTETAARDEAKVTLGTLRKFVTTFVAGIAKCPTCGTPTAVVADRIENAKIEIGTLEVRIDAIDARIAASKKFDEASKAWEEWKATYARRKAALDEDDKNLEEAAEEPKGSKEELTADVDAHTTLQAELSKARESQAAAASKHVAAKTTHALHEDKYKKEKAKARELRVPKADYLEAKDRVAELHVRLKEYGKLKGRVRELKRSIKTMRENIERLEEEEAEGERARALRSHLEAVRGVLHRENLPKKVTLGYLRLLEATINPTLAHFEAPFRVTTAEDLSYTAKFVDGVRVQPAIRLSGGQKTVLGWCFRIAVNSRFAADIGFLGLDEPTQFLDTESIGCLDGAIGRLGTLSESTGLQVILVTHERQLSRIFDTTISL